MSVTATQPQAIAQIVRTQYDVILADMLRSVEESTTTADQVGGVAGCVCGRGVRGGAGGFLAVLKKVLTQVVGDDDTTPPGKNDETTVAEKVLAWQGAVSALRRHFQHGAEESGRMEGR